MKKWLFIGLLGIGLALAQTAWAKSTLIKIDGSSTVYPITEAVAEEFQAAGGAGTQVTVGISGTGGGFKRFCRGETDISNASRPILRNEMSRLRAGGGEVTTSCRWLTTRSRSWSTQQNDWVDYLTVDELKKMWAPAAQGQVKSWKQIRRTRSR
ncbi:MAG: substrate-binding domain-containing protein [Candidatus Manganitrophus sp.]|nr:substrate-binding domain-containing protein [Candidatus Manganitrophus sp.]